MAGQDDSGGPIEESGAAAEGDIAAVAAGGAESEGSERRAHRRARVLWGATLRLAGETTVLSCTVANISAGGAKLLHACAPDEIEAGVIDRLAPGTAVVLMLRRLGQLPGQVVWRENARLGIRFSIPPSAVAARIGRVVDIEPT